MENELIRLNGKVDSYVERIYVDWPETDNDEFRFISSRMEDSKSDATPLVFQAEIDKNNNNNKLTNFSIDQLKFIENSSKRILIDSRYEDLSRKRTAKNLKDSSVPPLDLISQTSSIDIPGTKGIIDIDLRSSSDSLSNCSQEYPNQHIDPLERDSLDEERLNTNGSTYNHQHTPYDSLLNTTLPDVKHSDLMLNPGEYDSSRPNQPNLYATRKLSEISAPSQYRTEYHNNDKTGEIFDPRIENEKAAFEAARQKYRQPTRQSSESHKADFSKGSQPLKPVKGKPTLLVAPQIKQSLHSTNSTDKIINYIELNKVTTSTQKQPNQSSYKSKFIDRNKKESPKPVLKKAASVKDSLQYPVTADEKEYVDHNNGFANEEVQHKRGRSLERVTGDPFEEDHYDMPYINNHFPNSYNYLPNASKVMNPPQYLYAYNQYGEPVLINTDSISTLNDHSRRVNLPDNGSHYPNYNDYSISPDSSGDNPKISHSSPKHRKSFPNNQEIRKSLDSEFVLKDAAFKRQPTLYDENLLMRKLKELKAERIESRFPPIPNSRDSSQYESNGYAANLRRKEVQYEQYTLRDFRNFKQIDRTCGLGPNTGSESHRKMKEKLVRSTNYAKAVHEKNRLDLAKQNEKHIMEKSKISKNQNENPSSPSGYDSVSSIEARDDYTQSVQKDHDQRMDQLNSDSLREESKTIYNKKATSSTSAKDSMNKREAMLIYAKALQEKQMKKKYSKTETLKTQSASTVKEMNKSPPTHQIIDNADLELLLQRHENDKKIAEDIRQKLGKI